MAHNGTLFLIVRIECGKKMNGVLKWVQMSVYGYGIFTGRSENSLTPSLHCCLRLVLVSIIYLIYLHVEILLPLMLLLKFYIP